MVCVSRPSFWLKPSTRTSTPVRPSGHTCAPPGPASRRRRARRRPRAKQAPHTGCAASRQPARGAHSDRAGCGFAARCLGEPAGQGRITVGQGIGGSAAHLIRQPGHLRQVRRLAQLVLQQCDRHVRGRRGGRRVVRGGAREQEGRARARQPKRRVELVPQAQPGAVRQQRRRHHDRLRGRGTRRFRRALPS